MGMLQLSEFQTILAQSFFDGNTVIAGLVMYIAVLGLVFGLFRNLKATLIVSMPITLAFSLLGIIDTNTLVLLIIVTILGLATVARDTWRRRHGRGHHRRRR